MTTAHDDQDFVLQALPAFISEAGEQLETIEQLLLQLEEQPGDRELLDALFRCAHTVKGSAGIFGLMNVVAFTHHVETLLDRMREGEVDFTPGLSTLLLRCGDAIRQLVQLASDPHSDNPQQQAQRDDLVRQLQALAGTAAAADPPAAATPASPTPSPAVDSATRWNISATFGEDTFRHGMDPLSILSYLAGMGALQNIVCDAEAVPPLEALDAESCHLALQFDVVSDAPRDKIEAAFSFVQEDCVVRIDAANALPPAAAEEPTEVETTARVNPEPARPAPVPTPGAPAASAADAPRGAKARAPAGEEHRYIRVQADRLDAVINLLGELVVAGAGAEMLARQTRHGALIEANLHMAHLIEEIRNGTLQLRMVPIGETFSRFRRVVRDTAAELGKEVALEIVGGDTELDKSVVEKIADPLMHLVRNALDHGIESTEDRVAQGKPAQGRLTLSACHESGSILIRIEDDGRGIHRGKVLARAWERGLVEPGVTPSDDEIHKLIFEPGFSTAEKVTNLSGRGVGMDVVRQNIESLRGSVSIASTEGAGSCIEIRLPLTLAIIDGFLVSVDDSKFIFPLDTVFEVIENRPTQTPLDALGRSVVELRGQVLPVLSLRTLYGLDSPQPERSSVVVVRAGSQRFGVMVDQLLGQYQTVIKPLGRMFRSLRGMSGSSILGNGEVALIFDVVSLGQMAAGPPVASPHPARDSSVSPKTTVEGLSS